LRAARRRREVRKWLPVENDDCEGASQGGAMLQIAGGGLTTLSSEEISESLASRRPDGLAKAHELLETRL